jgi:membrane protein YqaA with SNARE-associated domain
VEHDPHAAIDGAGSALVVIDSVEGILGVYLATFAIAVVSGVVPVVNAELYLIGVVLAVGGIPEALALALLVALGQMIAKAVIYRASRGAAQFGERRTQKLAAKLERARALAERHRRKPLGVTFVSASLGLPPFYVVSILAGILEVRFRAFFAVGLAGRSLRFGTIAVVTAAAA